MIDQLKNKLHVEDFEHLDRLRSVLSVDHSALPLLSAFGTSGACSIAVEIGT